MGVRARADAGQCMEQDDFGKADGERRGRAASVYDRLGTLTSQAREARLTREARLRQRPSHPVEWEDGPSMSDAPGAVVSSGRTVPVAMREAASSCSRSWR